MNSNDTICAIATASGEAGIAVLRVSGPDSMAIAQKVFSSHDQAFEPGRFLHGTVHEPGKTAAHIDDALLLVFKAPHSYTGEDAVEIQCHGGAICSRRILHALIQAGARQAEPGEFTRRAFLNGKIDLLQAEAVADLIHAQSDRSAESALRQLEGSVSNWYQAIYNDIISASAAFEATLDFSEDELPSSIYDEPSATIGRVISRLTEALETWNDGRLLQEGARVAIAGRPNAGKSSLFNALLGYNRAIVTHIAGTTRDTVEDSIVIGGIVVHLIDTAGLRDSDCHIESEGISRAQQAIKAADLTLYVIDASNDNDPKELEDLQRLNSAKTILVLNKSDLPSGLTGSLPADISSCRCSCISKAGIEDLKSHIFSHLDGFSTTQLNAMNERHRQLSNEAASALSKAIDLVKLDPEQNAAIIASHLRTAALAIGSIIGAEYHNTLLDNIFQTFCIGK